MAGAWPWPAWRARARTPAGTLPPSWVMSSAKCATGRTSIPGTRRASARQSWGTTIRLTPAAAAQETAGRTPRTGRTEASSPSSPMKTVPAMASMAWRDSSWRAPRTARARLRSKPVPVLGRSAGERLAVTRRSPQAVPQVDRAARTRSRDSRTAASGSPTRVKPGSPWDAWASTWTRCPCSPVRVTASVRARPLMTTPHGDDAAGQAKGHEEGSRSRPGAAGVLSRRGRRARLLPDAPAGGVWPASRPRPACLPRPCCAS